MSGDDPDADTMVAYYCFINLGWEPSKYAAMPYRERLLISKFVEKELESRQKEVRK